MASSTGLSVNTPLAQTDRMVREIVSALRGLFVARPTASRGREMNHLLLQLIALFRRLNERMHEGETVAREDFVAGIREIVGDVGEEQTFLEERIGRVLIERLQASSWVVQRRPGQSRSDASHTILALYSGMVHYVKLLQQELTNNGVSIVDYDEDEESESEEEEEEEEGQEEQLPLRTRPAIPKPPPSFPQKPASAQQPKPKRTKSDGTGPGNHSHPSYIKWTNAEYIHLLKLFQKKPTYAVKDLAVEHTKTYWATKGRKVVRTTDSVRQQYKKLIGTGAKETTLPKIPARIEQLRKESERLGGNAEAGAGEEDEGMGDEEDEEENNEEDEY